MSNELKNRAGTPEADGSASEIARLKVELEQERVKSQRYRLAAESATNLIYEWDLSSRVEWLGQVDEILGYQPNEIPRTWEGYTNLFHSEDRDRVLAAVEKKLKSEEPYTIECRVRRKDGTYIYWQDRGTVVRDESGKPVKWLGVITDITARKQAEHLKEILFQIANVANSEISLEQMYRSIHDSIGALLPAKNFYIALPDSAKEEISFPYFVDQFDSLPPPHQTRRGLTEYVLRTGAPLLAPPQVFESLVRQGQVELRGENSVDWLGVPLRIGERTIGVMVVQSYTEKIRFGKRELEILSFVSSQVAMAIERKRAEEERIHSLKQLRKSLGATIQAMAVTVERRDPYTAGHQRRVSDLARTIATEMKLSGDQIDGIRMAAIIHDLGKISVPAEILSKPTKSIPMEFSLIKIHSQSGYDILKEIDFPWPIARIVLEHHERMDGSGYPNGLTGENLLIESRIIAVADTVEAISSNRPYRPSLGIEKALEEIDEKKGILFDPDVVRACLKIFREKGYKFPV